MQAPADTPTRPAEPPRPTAEPPWPPPTDGSRRTGWRPPALSPAAWLATSGVVLLFIASVIVVASRWGSLPTEIRFAGLVAALIAAYVTAEAGRARFPTTGTALASLAAAITAPVGIAAAATVEQPWPVCVLVGGVAALVCVEVQARRWRVPALTALTPAAFAMAATGAAGLTEVPAPVLAAVGAVGALAVGAGRRAVALAIAVGLAPALVLLDAADIGPGTLRRIGVVGDALSWSAPLSCALAAAVLAAVATRRGSVPLALGAVAVLTSGIVTGLVAGDVTAVVWWCVPGIALLAVEGLGSTRTPLPWRRLGDAGPALAVPLAFVGLFAPFVAVAHRVGAPATDPAWALPLLLGAAALAATAGGSARRGLTPWFGAWVVVGAGGAAVGAVAVAGAPLLLVAVAALAVWAAMSLSTDWRTWELTTGAAAYWGLIAVTADGVGPVWAQLAIVGAFGAAIALAVSFVERNDAGLRLVAAAIIIAGAVQLVVNSGSAATPLLAIVGVLALGATLRPDRALVPLLVAEAAVVLSFLDGVVGWTNVAGVAALAAACAGAADRSLRSPWAHLSAGFLVAAGALALHVGGLGSTAAAVLLGATAVALTGLATLRDDPLPIHTAAAVAGGLTVAVALGTEPVIVSLAVALLAAQGTVFGALFGSRTLTNVGAVGFVGAVISLWWTTGTNALVLDAIAPYGATGADVAVAATGVLLLAIGLGIRRATRQSSWLAYGPGLGLVATWLVATQLEPGTDWATLGALAVGVVAVGVGGVRRLAAPLVAGTAMIASTLVVSAGPRLAELPTWAWIATGGIGLVVLAALVERNERPLLPRDDAGAPSLLGELFRGFE